MRCLFDSSFFFFFFYYSHFLMMFLFFLILSHSVAPCILVALLPSMGQNDLKRKKKNRHTLKSSFKDPSHFLFLFLILFIAEKLASHKYDAENRKSISIVYFVIFWNLPLRDNEDDVISTTLIYSYNQLKGILILICTLIVLWTSFKK